MTTTTSDFQALKARLKSTWTAGDFGQIAAVIQPAAEAFIARRTIEPGMRVLDVACGTGNTAIPAARAGATVVGVDIAPNLLEQARERAHREGVQVAFDEADVEQLPYADASFDLVVTKFGAMFAPRPELVVAELARVCRPGGRLAMANWTPRGFVGQMFMVTGAHVPPPSGMPSPLLWGDAATVQARLHQGFTDIRLTPYMTSFQHPLSPSETVAFWRRHYGPTLRAFAALPEEKQPGLHRDLTDLWARHNLAADGTTHTESEYLEVLAVRR
jgi:ubiquinone/menaquinone biosynthesis C-methylase UbiE